MGFNDTLTTPKDLLESGVLSSYRSEAELYVLETYCDLNYCDSDIYNRKFRILEGKQLSLTQEYNIFDNILSRDFDTNTGFVNNDNKFLNFNSDNVLDVIYQMKPVTSTTNHLDIMYEGPFVRGYNLEGKYYDVQQAYAKSGHLLTDRGFVLNDYWDDTTFENVIPYNSSSDNAVRNQTLEVNGLYNTTGWLTDSPTSPVALIYGAIEECIGNDEFVKVNYNPDEVLVNTFYLGENGPLQYFLKPTNGVQPYIVDIEIFTYDKSKRKHMYIMYYGGIVNNVADKTKIHHVDYCDGDGNRISTFTYEYDSTGIINKITETY